MMDVDSKIHIAGHRGVGGWAICKRLILETITKL